MRLGTANGSKPEAAMPTTQGCILSRCAPTGCMSHTPRTEIDDNASAENTAATWGSGEPQSVPCVEMPQAARCGELDGASVPTDVSKAMGPTSQSRAHLCGDCRFFSKRAPARSRDGASMPVSIVTTRFSLGAASSRQPREAQPHVCHAVDHALVEHQVSAPRCLLVDQSPVTAVEV